ncbi:MAG: AMP-binding protein [Nevskia sp.]|nr:AMP-binding protein [Nevskia sp.]
MSFATRLEQFADQPAVIADDGSRLSYAGLAQAADRVFASPGAPAAPRTLIAVECDNTLPALCGYLGALRAGHPALLVDAGLPDDLRRHLYRHYQVATVWQAGGTWAGQGCSPPPLHAELTLLLSTSGSTGAAKLVRLSLRNLQANADSIAAYLELTAAERPITALPMHYSFGLSVINSHLAVGATLLLTAHSIAARPFWDFLRQQEATSFSGVPEMYLMLRRLRFERMALPSLRTLTQAGGRLDAEQVRWFAALCAERGQRFFVMYGQTEGTARLAYVPHQRLPEKASTIGIAIPGGAFELVDESGHAIAGAGTRGELVYRGPNVMLGYASCAGDLAAGDALHGVLRTGDIAWRDDDGFYSIAGRLKRFIKIFGNRIGLDEAEALLRAAGHDVVVTGRDGLLAIAVKDPQADAERIATEASARLRLHRSAIRAVHTAEIPLSGNGKPRYEELLREIAPAAEGG